MVRVLSLAGLFVLFAFVAAWGALALWYQAPFGTAVRIVAPVLWAATVLMGFAQGVATGFRKPLLNVAILSTGMFLWWSTIRPKADRDWAPEVSRIATGTIAGSTLTLNNVRNFNWRTEKDFDANWETRTYDLDKLSSLDLIASYWDGETIAHILLSFGFEDGRQIAWSTEVRKTKGQSFSTTAGFFKTSELAILAADERDILRLRTSVRNPREDVRIYRVNMSKQGIRELLVEYVNRANALNATPEWYNTATTNCTTVVFRLSELVAGGLPLDWRLLATGYFPNYVYDRHAMTPGIPFSELRERGKITQRANAANAANALPSVAFSKAIREGIPPLPERAPTSPAAAAPN